MNFCRLSAVAIVSIGGSFPWHRLPACGRLSMQPDKLEAYPTGESAFRSIGF
jgi:hypothetical protein